MQDRGTTYTQQMLSVLHIKKSFDISRKYSDFSMIDLPTFTIWIFNKGWQIFLMLLIYGASQFHVGQSRPVNYQAIY